MFELLTQIPGPVYLLSYAGFAAILLYLCYLWTNADPRGHEPLPDATASSPIEIAYLRGGWQAVVRSVVHELFE